MTLFSDVTAVLKEEESTYSSTDLSLFAAVLKEEESTYSSTDVSLQ